MFIKRLQDSNVSGDGSHRISVLLYSAMSRSEDATPSAAHPASASRSASRPEPAFRSAERVDDPVLEREWMAVARSDAVDATPLRVRVLGEDLVLWRNREGLHAFRDLCIHRGTALSLGRVVDDTLVCAYHGWRYDGSGRCVAIPAQPADAPIPGKARATRYRSVEQHGLIWVALEPGDTLPPPFREAEEDGFHTVVWGPYRLAAEAPRVIENFLDVSHLMWVHEGLLGASDHAEIPDHRVREEAGTLVSDSIAVFQPDPDGRGRAVESHYVYRVLRPLTAHFVKIDPGSADRFAMLFHATPVGARETVAYALLGRNYDPDADDILFTAFQDTIMAQDQVVVESQRPELLPLDLQAELHLRSDRLAIAYRRYLRERGVRFGVA